MTLNEYQERAFDTAIYPGRNSNLTYPTLGLYAEAGQLANTIKKLLRGDVTLDDCRGDIAIELGDVLWYVAAVATELGVGLDDVASRNLDKLAGRKRRHELKRAATGQGTPPERI